MEYTIDKIKEIIAAHIIEEFGSNTPKKYRVKHYSYCLYPAEDCTCNDLNEIDYDTQLINGGYIDSFSMVSVRLFLEETFDIETPDIDATPSNFNTINKMADLVKKYIK